MSLSADELAELARNRGLKLVRSRVRSPKKRLYGKLALSDPKGEPLFGFDDKGRASASPEAVDDYLRNLEQSDWSASLDIPPSTRKRKRRTAEGAADEVPERAPPPMPEIREAKPADAPRLAELMAILGHEVDAKGIRQRIALLARSDVPQLVATLDKHVVGLIGLHTMVALHRDRPVGRITILVVEENSRKSGIGRLLLEAAEELLRKRSCGMIEVTSNDRLSAAHAFYRHMGYEQTSVRLFKKL